VPALIYLTAGRFPLPGHPDCGLDLYDAARVVKSQGATVRRAYVSAGSWQTHRDSLYVAASRSSEGTRLFVYRESRGYDADALAEIVRRVVQSRAKVGAVSRKLPPPLATTFGNTTSSSAGRGGRGRPTGTWPGQRAQAQADLSVNPKLVGAFAYYASCTPCHHISF
jgi:hypothetical protein